MNSFKTVFIVVVLAAVAGAVYVLINNNSAPKPPAEIAEGWSSSPNVQMPDAGSSLSGFNSTGSGLSADSAISSAGGLAPPFTPGESSEGALGGGTAPPFPGQDSPESQATQAPPHGAGLNAPLPPQMGQSTEPSAASPGPSQVRKAFADFIQAARDEIAQGKLAEVHKTLSLWYDNPQLSPEEACQITELLDYLAGKVIYSREHVLERPYTVISGDTLPRIARKYGVPWQLLAKINGIRDPEHLQPGQQLKVVRGPFEAVVHLDRHEMTIMLRGLYAGRFPIGIGRDQQGLEGVYSVEDKVLQPEDPSNPLGRYWIRLSDRIGIHGTNDPRNIGTTGGPGSICLDDQDIEDVHDILSLGSRVQILR